jgi:hypothetical protein
MSEQMKMGPETHASADAITRDSGAVSANHLNEIEFLNATGRERFLTERQFQVLGGSIKEDRMTKLDYIYSKFEGLEEQVAHCYFLLQERFITNPPLAKFWAEAALEEMQHSSILALLPRASATRSR